MGFDYEPMVVEIPLGRTLVELVGTLAGVPPTFLEPRNFWAAEPMPRDEFKRQPSGLHSLQLFRVADGDFLRPDPSRPLVSTLRVLLDQYSVTECVRSRGLKSRQGRFLCRPPD
jgi:hypothetical protein